FMLIKEKMHFKHFPKFANNLSPDKINLSTLKGEGQLSNLELDEEVLQNMLDLPTWLAVTRVYCNKAAIRFLDKVEVEMRTCEEPRPPQWPLPHSHHCCEYGFAEKVVEGMSVIINSITIKVQARAFRASFELWQLQGNSLNPKWQRSDLRYTRITDPKRGEVLTFKEINWQSLRIEADAMEGQEQDLGSTPLRLITNQGRIRIALKRRVKDCNVLASKLLFILDDLLWVLTDSQLKAVIHYAKSLSEAMEKSAQQRKSMEAESLQMAPPSPGFSSLCADPTPPPSGTPSTLSQYFELHDDFFLFYIGVIADGDPVSRTVPDQPRRGSTAPPVGASLKRLRSSCMVVRVDDLDIHQVSSGGRHSKKKTQSLLSCNRKTLNLADNVPAVHIQFTEYYFPDNPGLPIPYSNLYAQMNGVQLCLDPTSLLWLNLFVRGLLHTLEQVKAFYDLQDSSKSEEHVDLRMDGTQLKVLVIPLESSILDHPDRPQSLSVTVPQLVLSNTRHCPHGSHADLSSTYASFSSHSFFQVSSTNPFPRDRCTFRPLSPVFLALSQETKLVPLLDKRPPRSQDVWSLSFSHMALSFEGARRGPKGKPLPFVEPFAMSVWMCRPAAFKNSLTLSPGEACHSTHTSISDHLAQSPPLENGLQTSTGNESQSTGAGAEASVHVLLQSVTPVKVWLNHFQYVALLRMKDTLARLGADLGRDARNGRADGQTAEPPTISVALLIDTVELGLLLPPAPRDPEEDIRSPPETESPSMTDSDLSPVHRDSATTLGVLEDSGIGGNGAVPLQGPHEQEELEEVEGVVEEACEAVEEGPDGQTEQNQSGPAPMPPSSPPLSPGKQSTMSRNVSTFSLEGELSNALNTTKDVTKDALNASLDLTKGALSITKDAFSMFSRGSAMSKILFSPSAKEPPPRSEESSPSIGGSLRMQTVKQSPSQHSFDSAILDGSLPDDGLSVDSDTSENFVILMDSGIMIIYITLKERVQSLILLNSASVLLLCLPGVGCVMEGKGQDAVVALMAQDLIPRQMGNQKISDLNLSSQNRPTSPSQQEATGRCTPVFSMRVEVGPSAARHSPLAETAGFLDMRVIGCRTELMASTIGSLGPFLEDELIGDVQPMRISLDGIAVMLKDDGPRVYPTAPQPVPVMFTFDGVVLERSDDGVFSLRGDFILPHNVAEPRSERLKPPYIYIKSYV
uniref:UHRF1 binding protein 1 n=1 Tax=Denticeps clupeoides TaxID=299321 RepID=A0AAY4CF06_9TELE